MSQSITVELDDGLARLLDRASRSLGKSPDETTAWALQERLRELAFPVIEFRSSAIGRQAYVRGTRLPVWQVVRLIQAYAGDEIGVASHLCCPADDLSAAEEYAAAFPDEIDAQIAAGAPSFEELQLILPNLERLPSS